MSFKLTTEKKSNMLFLRIEGDLMGEINGPQVIEEASNALNDNTINSCAIDLSEARYMNSSGIGVLMTLLTKFRNAGGDVVLINPSQHINKLLLMTKINAIFTIVEDDEEAEKSFLKSKSV